MDRYSRTVEGSLRYFLAKQGRSKERVCLEILARLAFLAPARYGCANTSCSRTFNQRANTCYCHCYRHIDVLSSPDDKKPSSGLIKSNEEAEVNVTKRCKVHHHHHHHSSQPLKNLAVKATTNESSYVTNNFSKIVPRTIQSISLEN